MCCTDATNKKRIGEIADPSNKAAWVNDVSIPRRGYPIGLWNSNAPKSWPKIRRAIMVSNILKLEELNGRSNNVHSRSCGLEVRGS